MNDTQLALWNDIFTGVYVVLTLAIVIFTALSLKITRDALTASKEQSREAINAVHTQIATSEKQAQEALLNQQKPVIVPISQLNVYHNTDYKIDMQNKGTGIAMNTWGIVYSMRSEKFFRLDYSHFLVPDKAESIALVDISGPSLDFLFPTREFHGYSIFPPEDKGRLGTVNRLMLTYNDVFDNKYLVIFDWSQQLGWRQFEGVKRIDQRLDEYFVEKRTNANIK